MVTKKTCHRLRRLVTVSSFSSLDCNESVGEDGSGFSTAKLVVCETIQGLHKIDGNIQAVYGSFFGRR